MIQPNREEKNSKLPEMIQNVCLFLLQLLKLVDERNYLVQASSQAANMSERELSENQRHLISY